MVSRLLGNTNTTTTSNTTAAATATTNTAALPNPVLKFLYSREEPKVISINNTTDSKSHTIRSNIDIRKLHQAGGYDYNLYEQRNWYEIKRHLREFETA